MRRDGRPHVTPLPAIWLDGVLQFCAGAREQKAKNLEATPGASSLQAPSAPIRARRCRRRRRRSRNRPRSSSGWRRCGSPSSTGLSRSTMVTVATVPGARGWLSASDLQRCSQFGKGEPCQTCYVFDPTRRD
ncbi:MAG TPA: pyridoxamine 5'-phosphate oxidase family protein [Chloroflexota bacterium]